MTVTGYTAEIVDGKIKTFPEFAKVCMRAFGATIHMRDEPMDKTFKMRKPSGYHSKKIKKLNRELTLISNLTDENLMENERIKLLKEEKYYWKEIAKVNVGKKNLVTILTDVSKWTPPTKDHNNIKDFMIQQISTTLSSNDTTYYNQSIDKIRESLSSLNADKIRKARISELKDSIAYNEKELDAEIKRCNKSNEWVKKLLKSLN